MDQCRAGGGRKEEIAEIADAFGYLAAILVAASFSMRTLFGKSDAAHEMFYVLTGDVQLREIDKTIGAGTVLGEISMFSPDRARTATAVCASVGELLTMSEDKVRQLYFQNPKFGFHLVQLITRRLLENCASMEALPGKMPDAERLHAREAA